MDAADTELRVDALAAALAGDRRRDNPWEEPDRLVRAAMLLRRNAKHGSDCNTVLREPCCCWLSLVDEWIAYAATR